MVYKNYISLGYFCNIASDLEELGFRNTSSPFDWEISVFEGVISAIDNRFNNFMNYEDLIQSEEYPSHYYDPNYQIWFFHDFNKYEPLKKQYIKVRNKYNRRITRFLKNITEPTLFFRYISNESGSLDELRWIESNHSYIDNTIKKYNPNNKIIYIGDQFTYSDIIPIFNVNRDRDDLVSRHPIIDNRELKNIMDKQSIPGQTYNIKEFKKKELYKKSLRHKISKKIQTGILAIKNGGVYRHNKMKYWNDK